MAFKNDVADDVAPRPALLGTPSGHPVWPPRLATCRAPRLATPSGTPSGTPVLNCGSGRPSISEPLDRCPFGPPTVALPFTYIKPSNPPLHHFLHSPICIGTCDCIATAALRGSWSLGAGSNCLGASPSSFFSSIYIEEGWSLILSSPRMIVVVIVTAREEEEEGAGSG
jgi:hypothetical protein